MGDRLEDGLRQTQETDIPLDSTRVSRYPFDSPK